MFEQAFRRRGHVGSESSPRYDRTGSLGIRMGRRDLMDCARCGAENPPANRFCGDCGALLSHAPTARSAERRQLTIMFCDLVGSTEIATRFDPEEVRHVNRAYREVCAAIVARFDGSIASYMGDGIMVYFGYPQAHEDDAERSVHAGLAVVHGVQELEPLPGLELHMRVGIATGLVVAGDLVGEGTEETRAVSGETPNLAARLQGLADPDELVIDEQTHRLLGGYFECESLGKRALKGVSEPVASWRVLHEVAVDNRFEAVRGTNTTALVGRDAEVGLLLQRWADARAGRGQTVLISGEAGIGKSRMLQTLGERIAGEPHISLRYQCSPYHSASSLHPIITQLQHAAGITPEDSPDRKLDKLEQLPKPIDADVHEYFALLAALLSIPTGDRYLPLAMPPQRQKEKLLEALIGGLTRAASEHPAIVFFEDVHWIDPTTLELLDRIVDQIGRIPAMMLLTFRPDFTPPWSGRSHVTHMALGNLDRGSCISLVENVVCGRTLPRKVLEWIVDKADGVPLFVEELTKSVLESSVLREDENRFVLEGALTDAIPSTLHGLLEARLDRLVGAKAVAQIGAVIGREFPFDLLAGVSELAEAELQAALDQLSSAGLAHRRGVAPRFRYVFKHALVRDVAYASLLKSHRRELHGRIATVLEASFPERASAEPELLAHHFTEADRFEQALAYWQRAGRRSAERSANVEACEQLGRALGLIDRTLAAGRSRDELELDLNLSLAACLIAAKGYSAPETERTYARALELCERIGETPQIFPVLYGRWIFHVMSSQVMKSRALANDFLRLANLQKAEAECMMGHRLLGSSLQILGQPAAARPHLEQALSLFDPEKHHALIYQYGHDAGVAGRCNQALALWLLGYPERGLRIGREAIERAKAISHPNSLGYAILHIGGLLHALCGLAKETLEYANALQRLSAEHQLPIFESTWRYFAGWALVDGEDVEQGVSMMRQSKASMTAARSWYMQPIFATFLSRGCAALGAIEEGARVLDEAEDLVANRDERWFEAELHRARGDLLTTDPDGDRARIEDLYRRSIEVARQQEAKSLELRAATSLALLLREERPSEARGVLEPVFEWFSEGFELPDLRRAKRLLDEIA